MARRVLIALSVLLLGACGSPSSPSSQVGGDTTSPEEAALQAVLDDHWAMVLRERPTFATRFGERAYDDQLPDPSLVAYAAAVEARRMLRERLEAISPERLSETAALNRSLLLRELRDEIEASNFGGKYVVLTNRSGPHLFLTGLYDSLPFRTEADYRSYVSRLREADDYLAAATERLRAGIEAGWTQSCEAMLGYEKSIDAHRVSEVADSVFMTPFNDRPSTIELSEFEDLRANASMALIEEVLPAFDAYFAFYTQEYAPACRETPGVLAVEGGLDYYDHRVRHFTTLETDAEAVHQRGLAEVARIRAEMEAVAAEAGFEALSDFQNHLRTDPKFYPKTGQERIEKASTLAKRMDGQLVNLFTVLPRTPYDVRPIPLDIAEKTTSAYYSEPSPDGGRAGTYWVNTTKLDTRPLHELEALTLHESVPGHHLQIALAQELDLPAFRRYGGFTAFVEGWALYSERLGLEVGFYQTPETNFGRLSYEMWRACRLVVDTGLHAKGWSRQQAIDYMVDNTGLSLNNITTEVDRYITWPGQALAYKTGELTIRALRARAEDALGPEFDLRAFHDEILKRGALPMAELEAAIDAWIAERAADNG